MACLRFELTPGIKIAAQVSPEPSEEDLVFIRQMGLEYVVLWISADQASYEYYASRRQLFKEAGLKVLLTKEGVGEVGTCLFFL